MKGLILADIEFELEWKSPFASHTDIYTAHKIDPINDRLPLDFGEKISKLEVGEGCSHTFQAKVVLENDFSPDQVIPFDESLFDTSFKGQHSPPILYRFYPSAIAWQGLDTDETDFTPFRLISSNDGNMVADRNHPLAKYYLSITAKKLKEHTFKNNSERRKRNISKLITSKGPGMQAPFEYGDSAFFDKYPFDKKDDQTSIQTTTQKATKLQLDSNAIQQITKLYSQLLPKHSKVLDLMSSKSSYLAANYETGLLAGIGEDEEALSKNERLNTYQVQDLNTDTILPFEENSFDDAICTLSIECLSDPLKIIKEVARVVNSGGKFIITFSNSVSPQSINLWGQLHPFERIQLVLEYFRKTEIFEDLNTYSKRGMLRTAKEKESDGKPLSDPIYAVWGVVK